MDRVTPEHLPPHLLDRAAAGLLDEDAQAGVDRHAADCPTCAEALAEVRAEREAFLAANPPPARAEALLAKGRPQRRLRWTRWLTPALAAAAAAVALMVFQPWEQTHLPEPEVLLKGGGESSLAVLAKPPGGGSFALVPSGATLAPGTVLRLEVIPAGRPHVALLAVDAEGAVQEVLRAEMDRPGPLPRTLTFEGADGAEALVVVFAKEPVGSGPLERAISEALRAAGGAVTDLGSFEVPGAKEAAVEVFVVEGSK